MNYWKVHGGQLSVILLQSALFDIEVCLRNGGMKGLVSLITFFKTSLKGMNNTFTFNVFIFRTGLKQSNANFKNQQPNKSH